MNAEEEAKRRSETEEQKSSKSEEVKEEGTEENIISEAKKEKEGSEEMLQQLEAGRQAYAGRGSIGSTTSGGRLHPVNGICTCSRCTETLNDLQSQRGYKSAESPHSTHSEVMRSELCKSDKRIEKRKLSKKHANTKCIQPNENF